MQALLPLLAALILFVISGTALTTDDNSATNNGSTQGSARCRGRLPGGRFPLLGFNPAFPNQAALANQAALSNQAAFQAGWNAALASGANPALANQGFNPALANQGFNPALGNQGFNPALANQGFNPAFANQGWNPAMNPAFG